MSARRPPHRRTARALSALGLALLIAATATPVTAHPRAASSEPQVVPLADGGERAPDDLGSIHWLHEQEHAHDVIAFEPGERVTVPFRPRSGDAWEIDGKPARALPPGHASGTAMRDAPQGSIWADGAPGRSEQAGPPATDSNAGVDQPTGDVDAVADPAAASFDTTAAGDGTVAAAPVGPNGLRREVFGFLPYWEVSDPSTVLDWRVLSTVAYFSVGCRGNGDLHKRNSDGSLTTGWAGWTSSRMTSIINAAHEKQSRVVLTVSCFAWSSANAQTQAALLGSSTARANLARQIAAAVRDRGADGVNLDFEPIVAGYADEFTLLVRRVRTELNNVAPGYQLTFDTTGYIGNQPIAEATAPGGADAVFIMGYDYRTAGANYAGSIAPLTGPAYDLTDTVKAYTAKISPSKVILGVPWYGRAWSTESDALHARTLSPSKFGASAAPFYADAMGFLQANGRRWDAVEQSAWTAYRRQTCTSTYGCVTAWRQLYVDDPASMKLRYDLVNRQLLRGVGIWALGYDDGRPEMRTALADKFLLDKTPPLAGVSTLAQGQRDEAFRVSWKAWDDSSIKDYDVDISIDGGTWTRWKTATTASNALYIGRDDTTYAFRARATDVHGNTTPWNAANLGALAIPGDVAVGGFAAVLTDGLRLRSSASTGGNVMTTLDAGDVLHVIGGPVQGEGYTWFRVSGPIKQWSPVDPYQVGGWVAAYGNGATNIGPRRPAYATRVDAGITDLRLNGSGLRVLVPGADGGAGKVHLEWTNQIDFDSLALRVTRLDGTFVGAVALGATAAGPHDIYWEGRLDGAPVDPGAYVLQLQGLRNGWAYNAPAATPLDAGLPSRFGVMIWPAVPTAVKSFASSPVSPTQAGNLLFTLTFGGPVQGLTWSDVVRSGTATGCKVGLPTGGPAVWKVPVTGCSAGTVLLTLKSKTVSDAVSNWGPGAGSTARVVIDRSKPTVGMPNVRLRSGITLGSGLPALLSWTASDPGGAGIRDYDVRRSVDGGPFTDLAVDLVAGQLAVVMPAGHTYRFTVRARDRAGNVGYWVAGPTYRAGLVQQDSANIAWAGTWRGSTIGSAYSGGTARYTTTVGSSAKLVFTGRGIAIVTTLGPDRGAFKLYVDGSLVGTISTYAPAVSYRHVVFAKGWSSSGFHTIRLVAVGTPGHPRVDLDAFEILR